MNVEAVLQTLLYAAILSSVPLMLAAVGESVSERAGLLNLGVEGVMAVGAFAAYWTTVESGSAIAGIVAGLLCGAAIGVAFGLLATTGRADQVVLGLGCTLAGTGGTAFLFREQFGASQPLLDHGMGRPFAGTLDAIPAVGPAIADQRWFVYAAVAIAGCAHLLLTRTRFGLQVRAAGDTPFALEAVGISVSRVRTVAAIFGCTLAGMGGAALSVVELGFFSPGVTGGTGFLAIALAMLGRLSPAHVACLCVGFGFATGIDTVVQVRGWDVRPEFLHMIPYLGVVLALVVWGRGIALPRSLGRPYGDRAASVRQG